MYVRNHTSSLTRKTSHQLNTLVISPDHTLFRQFSSFLKEFEPERSPILIDTTSSLSSVEHILEHCDVVLCDIRSNHSVIELGSSEMKRIPPSTLSIGLINNNECSSDVLNRPQHLRLGGIIDDRNGWLANWHQIAALRQAWCNPLMVSRIEEVPVSDVIQMISSGRWNTIVHIDGLSAVQSGKDNLAGHQVHGCISFFQGQPQTAWSSQSAGVEAMFDLLSIRRGILQVIKNICAPTIRNVFLHTDEILLSHAVNIDESTYIKTADPKQNSSDGPEPTQVPLLPESSVAHAVDATSSVAGWWKTNGPGLIETIINAKPRSLPLRWMNDAEFSRLTPDRSDSKVLFLYGNTNITGRLFALAARSEFNTEKLKDTKLFPVLRLGKERCLYIAGLDPAADCISARNHCAVLFRMQEEPDIPEQLCHRNHTPMVLITDQNHDAIPEDCFMDLIIIKLNNTQSLSEYSWQDLTKLLQDIISTLMKRI